MSKKLYSTSKWKKRIAAGQAREAKKESRRKHGPYGGTRRKAKQLPSITLTPPSTLSFVKNPDETIRFLRDLERAIPHSRVHIEFRDVSIITPEAPLALLGTLRKFPSRSVGGSVPDHPDARAVLEHSGFFDHVRHRLGLTIRADAKGAISQYSGTKVNGELARSLVWRGTELLSGQAHDSEPSYGILLEGMENTIAHAFEEAEGKHTGQTVESWWASVYVDRTRSRICFSLVDAGVGILKSARVNMLRKIDRIFRQSAEAEILANIFEGLLQSRTGLDNRGKGLPSIKKLSDSGVIKNLTFVTNTVHADLQAGRFETMSESYSGTLIYWEIEE